MKKLIKIIRFKDICNLIYISKSEQKKQNSSFFNQVRTPKSISHRIERKASAKDTKFSVSKSNLCEPCGNLCEPCGKNKMTFWSGLKERIFFFWISHFWQPIQRPIVATQHSAWRLHKKAVLGNFKRSVFPTVSFKIFMFYNMLNIIML